MCARRRQTLLVDVGTGLKLWQPSALLQSRSQHDVYVSPLQKRTKTPLAGHEGARRYRHQINYAQPNLFQRRLARKFLRTRTLADLVSLPTTRPTGSKQRELPMYAAVRRYEGINDDDEAARLVRDSFMPQLEKVQGFIAYY